MATGTSFCSTISTRYLIGLIACMSLTGCVTPADANRMTAPQSASSCPLASRFPNSILLSEVSGGEPTEPFGYTTVDNEGLGTAVSDSLRNYGLLNLRGLNAQFRLRVDLADLVRSGAGFTKSTTAFIRYRLFDTDTSLLHYDNVVDGKSTLSVVDAAIGQERRQRTIEYAVRDSILTFLSDICNLDIGITT